jgi:hypothetical protein
MRDLLVYVLALSFAIMWHEAAHAAFALATSRGRVVLQVGFGPAARVSIGRLELRFAPILFGGFCTHDGGERRGDNALIAAAGPIASAFLAALALSTYQELRSVHPALAALAREVVIPSSFAAIFTALPIRYPGGHDSDGLAVLRALRPASRVVVKAPRLETRPERPLRAPFAVALAICGVLGFIVSFWIGAVLVALFGLAWLDEQHAA